MSHETPKRLPSAAGYTAALSPKQRELRKAYGTPAEFALACYASVPSDVSMDEAAAALQKYQKEWDAAV